VLRPRFLQGLAGVQELGEFGQADDHDRDVVGGPAQHRLF
jgi:hypothetical protein